MTEKNETFNMLTLVSEIVAAYVSHHEIPSSEIPALIHQVYSSLSTAPEARGYMGIYRQEPAVPNHYISSSVSLLPS